MSQSFLAQVSTAGDVVLAGHKEKSTGSTHMVPETCRQLLFPSQILDLAPDTHTFQYSLLF